MSNKVLQLGLLTKHELDYINKNIRHHGNFSAHLASGILQGYVQHQKILSVGLPPNTVVNVLTDTAENLEKVIISYFNNKNMQIHQRCVPQNNNILYTDYIITPIIP